MRLSITHINERPWPNRANKRSHHVLVTGAAILTFDQIPSFNQLLIGSLIFHAGTQQKTSQVSSVGFRSCLLVGPV